MVPLGDQWVTTGDHGGPLMDQTDRISVEISAGLGPLLFCFKTLCTRICTEYKRLQSLLGITEDILSFNLVVVVVLLALRESQLG